MSCHEDIRILQVAAEGRSLNSFVRPLMDKLRARGYHVEAAARHDRGLEAVREAGYVVHPIRIAQKLNPIMWATAIRDLHALIRHGNYDIVHTHTSFGGLLGNFAARLAGARHLIYTQHGFYAHELMPRWQQWLSYRIESIAIKQCDHMICVSEEEKEIAIRQTRRPCTKFTTVPGIGIDVDRFNLSAEERSCWRTQVRDDLGIAADALVILTVARLTRDKGHYEALRALHILANEDPEVRLVVAGDGPEAEGLAAEAAELGVNDQLMLLGWREDIVQLHCAADVFLLASHREGMPVSTMEATASGLPVVATDISGCREQVVPNVTGYLVPVGDAETMATALCALRSDPALRSSMGKEAQQRAPIFDVENVVETQLDLYSSVIARLRNEAVTGQAPTSETHVDRV